MPTTFAKPINKFSTTLLTAHTSGSGTFALRSVSGLGTLDANQVFRVTALTSPNTSSETIVGIFEATGISGSTLTGVTAVEGYSDTLIAANTTIQIRATAKTFTDLQSAVNTLETAASTYALDSAVVHDTGDETIAGTKTFSTTIVGSISGNAATVTNGVYTSGSYANPSWITSLAGSKVSGDITGNSANVSGTVAIANGGTGQTTAANAINALAPSQTGNSGKYLTTNGTTVSWGTVSVSPGGSSGQLQYNSSSTFAGAAWSTIATSGDLLTIAAAANADKPVALVGKSTTATITNIAITSNVATITTSAAHGFVVGRYVALSGLTTVTSLNSKRFIVLSSSSTTFTFYCAVSSQASASETGSAVSMTSTVPAVEVQDGSGLTTVRINGQPSGTASGSPTTTAMSAAGVIEAWHHASDFQNTLRTMPWLTYNVTTMESHGLAARIALRQGYSAATTYDAAAIDLGLSEAGSGGRIRFFTGGNGNGTALVYAGEFSANGRLSLTQPLIMSASTGQNAQFGYSNNVDTTASLFLGTNTNKGLVLQTPQFSATNAFELQQGGGNTIIGGITYQGNWWMGTPTTNSGTTRLIIAPRQTTDVGLMVAGIASQTGPLFALAGRSSTTDNVAMGYVDAVWSDSTHASRLADVVISTTGYNGTHEAIRFRDTSGIAQPIIPIANVRDAADDAAAAALTPAVPVGGLYRTGSILKIRVS